MPPVLKPRVDSETERAPSRAEKEMMNTNTVARFARSNTPSVRISNQDGWLRHDVTKLLNGNENIGIELGVASGIYARRMLESNKFKRFYGVDIYGDIHDINEYCQALKYIGFNDPRYSLLRMDFDYARSLFEDEYFDFIYIDGYAHTGEEGGKTLQQWYEKLKIGGVFAGDDYHEEWPLVKWAVNDFVLQIGAKLHVTTGKEDADYSMYPTWFIIKDSNSIKPKLNQKLYKVAMSEKKRIYRLHYKVAASEKKIIHKLRVGEGAQLMRVIGKILSFPSLKGVAQSALDYLKMPK